MENQEERRWVILKSIPVLVEEEEEQKRIPPGNDAWIELHDSPHPSLLLLPSHTFPPSTGYEFSPLVIAVCSDCVLFRHMFGHGNTFFLYNARSRILTGLPTIPSCFGIKFETLLGDADGRLNIGLIEDPRRAGHYVVAVLHPDFGTRRDKIVCYSTGSNLWTVKMLASPKGIDPWIGTCPYDAAVSHDGELWWLNEFSGQIFHCNPFLDRPFLHFTSNPFELVRERPAYVTHPSINIAVPAFMMAQSEGKLRFVATVKGYKGPVKGPGVFESICARVSMWTLTDPSNSAWDLDFNVPLPDVWESLHDFPESDALRMKVVPSPALVAPNNASEVCFFAGSKLFSLNMRNRQVEALGDSWGIHSSHLFLNAWELPPEFVELYNSPVEIKAQGKVNKPWVVLTAIPSHVRDTMIPADTDVLFKFADPPHPSYLALPSRFTPDMKMASCFPYIIATHPSGGLLFHATQQEGITKTAFFFCHVESRVVTRLPDVPGELRLEAPPDHLGLGLRPRRSGRFMLRPRRNIGLIADPQLPGSYMIAQLHPTSSTQHESLLHYSTLTGQWGVKRLESSPRHKPWAGHGAFSLRGKLWWADVAHGVLTCNPFREKPRLRLVKLPEWWRNDDENGHVKDRVSLDKFRMIRQSEGRVCFVGIKDNRYSGPSVTVYTLDDEVTSQWTINYHAPFSLIWAAESYMMAGLPDNEVPALAALHPMNRRVVYFFHGVKLFSVDLCSRRVLSCKDCIVDCRPQDMFQSSRFIHAWEMPANIDLSTAGGLDNWCPGDNWGAEHQAAAAKFLANFPRYSEVIKD